MQQDPASRRWRPDTGEKPADLLVQNSGEIDLWISRLPKHAASRCRPRCARADEVIE